ncbi:hypothetical protein CA13_14460 [Planctomycetes bacterium CA13]|uniref:Lipoprotein n=1 Tax=Novipirellula herctigrandis TaxID=2527986 RepID=A0A5C5YYB0_9BACT|nr:hypothetical protein CA13_14460 [Planctomycetes bacterium CA13]
MSKHRKFHCRVALSNAVLTILFCLSMSLLSGCTGRSNERVAKHRSSKEVLGRWMSVRGSRGQDYTTKHVLDGEEFSARWVLTKHIGGSLKLQLKLPPEWNDMKVYDAVQSVFMEEDKQPWFYPIEDVFLEDLRRALLSKEEEVSIPNGTPDMAYFTNTLLKRRDYEYFIELTAEVIPDMD